MTHAECRLFHNGGGFLTRSRRRATRRYTIACACFLGGSLAGAVAAQTPTLSLKAVRINPFCIGGADAGTLCSQDADCASLNCGGEITPTNQVTRGAVLDSLNSLLTNPPLAESVATRGGPSGRWRCLAGSG